jgi:hypothetical protein
MRPPDGRIYAASDSCPTGRTLLSPSRRFALSFVPFPPATAYFTALGSTRRPAFDQFAGVWALLGAAYRFR